MDTSVFALQDSEGNGAMYPHMNVAPTFVRMAPHVTFSHQIFCVNVCRAMAENFAR